jgi:hypothetical protein
MLNKIIAFFLLLLAGCATHQTPFVPVNASVEKGSAVYIYRASEVSNLMVPPEINIKDGQGVQTNIGRLRHGEYKLVFLKPGQYEIQLGEIKYYAPGEEVMIDIKPDSVNYLRLDSSLKFETGARYKSYERKFTLQEVEVAFALDEMASCIDVDSKPKNKNRAVEVESDIGTKDVSVEDDEAYFSTDKTTDPFSRNK